MTDPQIITSKNSLVKVRRYVSPEYSRKCTNISPGVDNTTSMRSYEDAPKEDCIEKWLEENTLCKFREPFPNQYSNQLGYFMQAPNGVSCIINPSYHQLTPRSELEYSTKPLMYRWDLTIKSQPKDLPIPSELEKVLEEMKFIRVEIFDDKGIIRINGN